MKKQKCDICGIQTNTHITEYGCASNPYEVPRCPLCIEFKTYRHRIDEYSPMLEALRLGELTVKEFRQIASSMVYEINEDERMREEINREWWDKKRKKIIRKIKRRFL